MRKICVVTGSRAEYGLLSGLMRAIQEEPELELQIIATNMHLSPEFGLTYKEIESDGFFIDKKVVMLLSSDTANATAKSVGLGFIGFADAYEELHPDLIVVLGDRYEIISAVSTALFYKIPVAHLHGGEITEGAYDDCIRHAITKMSHLHFTSTEEYRKRVIQLGEHPDRVFNVGAPGVENIKKVRLMNKEKLEATLDGFTFGDKSLLVTYHPVTLESGTAAEQIQNLLSALDRLSDYKIIFTLPNSDTDGRVITKLINEYVVKNPKRAIAYPSLGLRRYLSALKYVRAVVGNSSSGIIEVPSFGIPTLNIGERQKGRLAANSVVNCGTGTDEILSGLCRILSSNFNIKEINNPYEGKNTTGDILHVIKTYPLEGLIQKSFYNNK
ncbi:UDP-N-acetylglucosamine 2-epimerase (hydrolyzing) [Bacteroides xylanisolvens]|uniref:UDP-N-acetylglucosamine 2-epimerase (Hydrolyzing) n=1 Tax=Bacteroides xylanisolvens TaxID=371601 RepID=A0A415HFZ4_9BACE|nr:UDP-N-acetylglucosamine 2-epimerase [Bacteroides xylanisolvens]RHK91517.1 UDP-N-acetylglucosamine 2-epimerase (hydrolyzing) [Bacteroides xylanisolvens]